MKSIILFFLLFASCASLDDGFHDARRRCTHLLHEKGININQSKSSLKQKAYTDCVAQTANAKANVSGANATWASVITLWVTTGVTILVGLIR